MERLVTERRGNPTAEDEARIRQSLEVEVHFQLLPRMASECVAVVQRLRDEMLRVRSTPPEQFELHVEGINWTRLARSRVS